MDLGEETKDEWHTLYPLFFGVLGEGIQILWYK